MHHQTYGTSQLYNKLKFTIIKIHSDVTIIDSIIKTNVRNVNQIEYNSKTLSKYSSFGSCYVSLFYTTIILSKIFHTVKHSKTIQNIFLSCKYIEYLTTNSNFYQINNHLC